MFSIQLQKNEKHVTSKWGSADVKLQSSFPNRDKSFWCHPMANYLWLTAHLRHFTGFYQQKTRHQICSNFHFSQAALSIKRKLHYYCRQTRSKYPRHQVSKLQSSKSSWPWSNYRSPRVTTIRTRISVAKQDGWSMSRARFSDFFWPWVWSK